MAINPGGVDARGYLKGWAMALADMTSKDIRAIPEDKWNSTLGGCTKSPCDVAVDAVALMIWTAEALKGNVVTSDEPYMKQHVGAACATRDGAIAQLNAACRDFAGAISTASDEALNTVVTPPWKMDAPLYMIAQIAVSHIWYHDGQLNYIQCLHGDDRIHWMDEAVS